MAACSVENGAVEITTSKAGKIDTDLYDQAIPVDKQDASIGLTPLVETTDKSITDDGKGLYNATGHLRAARSILGRWYLSSRTYSI